MDSLSELERCEGNAFCLDNELSNLIMQRLSALQPELLASILKTG